MRLAVRQDRLLSGALVVAIHAAGLWVLLAGLGPATLAQRPDATMMFDVPPANPDPPPPPPEPDPRPSPEREGAASPANLRQTATPIVAPPPIVPLPVPIPAAPVPNLGFRPDQGAAEVEGPGTGSGGEGQGTGSGRWGDGGGGGGRETPPRWRSGRIRDSDYPEELADAGVGGAVEVRYVVATNGRAVDCAVERSSGSALLDDTTCRLIERRFRFRPSLDEAGRPVESTIIETHHWVMERLPAEEGQ